MTPSRMTPLALQPPSGRPEGAYVGWELYPPDQPPGLATMLFFIDIVSGDSTVRRVVLTPDEARLVVAKLTDGLSRL